MCKTVIGSFRRLSISFDVRFAMCLFAVYDAAVYDGNMSILGKLISDEKSYVPWMSILVYRCCVPSHISPLNGVHARHADDDIKCFIIYTEATGQKVNGCRNS